MTGACSPSGVGVDTLQVARQIGSCDPDPVWEDLLERVPFINKLSGHVIHPATGLSVEAEVVVDSVNGVDEFEGRAALTSKDPALDLSEYRVRIRKLGCAEQPDSWQDLSSQKSIWFGYSPGGTQPIRWLLQVYRVLGDEGAGQLSIEGSYMLASPARIEQIVPLPSLQQAMARGEEFSITYESTDQTGVKADLRYGTDHVTVQQDSESGWLDFGSRVAGSQHVDPEEIWLVLVRTRRFELNGQFKASVQWGSVHHDLGAPEHPVQIGDDAMDDEDVHEIVKVDYCSVPGNDFFNHLTLAGGPRHRPAWLPVALEPAKLIVLRKPSYGVDDVTISWTTKHAGWGDQSPEIALPLDFDLEVHVAAANNLRGDPRFEAEDVVVRVQHMGCAELEADDAFLYTTRVEHTGYHLKRWTLKRNLVGGEARSIAETVYRSEDSAIPLRVQVLRRYSDTSYVVAADYIVTSPLRNQCLEWVDAGPDQQPALRYEHFTPADSRSGTSSVCTVRAANGSSKVNDWDSGFHVAPQHANWSSWTDSGIHEVTLSRQRVVKDERMWGGSTRYSPNESVVFSGRGLRNWPKAWLVD